MWYFIVVGNAEYPMPRTASQALWAFFLLEAARNATLTENSGIVRTNEVANAATWSVENYENVLWRVNITTKLATGNVTNVWEGNSNCFYSV